MCVIYMCQTGRPNEEELEAGAWRNDDGGGIAWLSKDTDGNPRVNWKKGFTDHKDLTSYLDDEKIPLPYVIHFRTASVGGKDPELCHPFPVAKGAPTWLEGTGDELLFHNGHVTNWQELTLQAGLASREQFPEGPWSDTRALAWLVHLKGRGIIPFVSGSSRILLFSAEAYIEPGVEYNPATDHFTTYGHWVHEAALGYSQSVVVSKAWKSPKEAPRSLGPINAEVITASKNTTRDCTSIWTVRELEDVIAKLEKDQNDARLAAGI